MAYKLPPDIESELQSKFPEVHVPTFVDALFQSILTKIIKHSECTVREFGKFNAFVTYSKRLSKDIIRLKFKISTALNNKIKNDQYLLNNLPVKAQNSFTKKHQEKCDRNKEQRSANLKANQETTSYSRKKTSESVAAELITQIVNK